MYSGLQGGFLDGSVRRWFLKYAWYRTQRSQSSTTKSRDRLMALPLCQREVLLLRPCSLWTASLASTHVDDCGQASLHPGPPQAQPVHDQNSQHGLASFAALTFTMAFSGKHWPLSRKNSPSRSPASAPIRGDSTRRRGLLGAPSKCNTTARERRQARSTVPVTSAFGR